MEPKRVLICGFTEAQGGMETYIMNIYRHCDRDCIQFDFLNVHSCDIAYKDEIEQLGGHIYYVPLKSHDFKMHYKALDELFSQNSYSAVYYQCTHKLVSLDVFKYAKKYGVKKRVIHSHSSRDDGNSLVHRLREKLTELRIDKYVTDFFACSKQAGEWMFSGRKFTVIKNGIDTNIFCYKKDRRDLIRKEYGIENKLVIGTVGRLAKVKNIDYMISVFKELHKRNSNTIFLHIGDGELKESIEEKLKENDIKDSYLLLGAKKEVADYLNAMDIFLLPSFHEGFPFVLIEAQATGLPCLASDVITTDCNLANNVTFLPIDNGVDVWVEQIECLPVENRMSQTTVIQDKGYDIQMIAQEIQNYF